MAGPQLTSPPAGCTVGEKWGEVGVTCLRPVESNVGDRDHAAQKAPEGMTDRQTHTHTRSVHYMMISRKNVHIRCVSMIIWEVFLFKRFIFLL